MNLNLSKINKISPDHQLQVGFPPPFLLLMPPNLDGQTAHVVRFKPKNGYYFSGSPNQKLPIVSPQHRPFSEKLLKPSVSFMKNYISKI